MHSSTAPRFNNYRKHSQIFNICDSAGCSEDRAGNEDAKMSPVCASVEVWRLGECYAIVKQLSVMLVTRFGYKSAEIHLNRVFQGEFVDSTWHAFKTGHKRRYKYLYRVGELSALVSSRISSQQQEFTHR